MLKKYFLFLILIFYLIKIKALPPPIPPPTPPPELNNSTKNSTAAIDTITLTRPCPESYSKYCYNRGKCYAAWTGKGNYKPFCHCARGFHGPHCEYLFNPDVYGF
uniref:EGF-like domain-containing protein n=1 Tax=Meloidogyne enterolobii TaxID=390850 RepID=A0A6V7U4D1_MELEN|nr:unnamed protein product [Meloidogyne enterolobii]